MLNSEDTSPGAHVPSHEDTAPGAEDEEAPPLKRQKVMDKQKALSLREEHVAPSLSLHYSKVKPLKIVYGRGQYLYDEQDQPYLDCINNVTHECGCTMLAIFSLTLSTEANDLALRIAEAVTGHTEVIVIEGAYHGHSKPLMGLSSYKMRQEKDGVSRIQLNPHAWIATLPDPYRGQYTDRDTAGEKYAGEVKAVIDKLEQQGKKLACFMCESFPGCAGQMQLPKGYFKAVFEHVHRAGGLCIVDEVQTGFGRGGEYFWIFESQGVQPDIVTIGKPMANGHPISAVVTTEAIATEFLRKEPDIHNEYTGDPVSLAIADAVLTAVEEEQLQDHARELGEYIMSELKKMARDHPCIGDVRGYGLFIGVELVVSPDTREPDGELAQHVIQRMMLKHRILVMNDGLDRNVLKIKPPLCFDKDNSNSLLKALEQVLSELGH